MTNVDYGPMRRTVDDAPRPWPPYASFVATWAEQFYGSEGNVGLPDCSAWDVEYDSFKIVTFFDRDVELHTIVSAPDTLRDGVRRRRLGRQTA